VRSECLPFSQIPHSTPLFTDFLSYQSNLHPFYPHSPFFAEWLRDEASAVRYEAQRRERVAAILDRQNNGWGASAAVTNNINRLRHGALAVVTGQQVGLFGGPLFAIYKALTAVKLADLATRSGVDCVPVFWLATEDHDLAEVNHTFFPGIEGLQKLTVPSHSVPDAPVGTVTFGEEILPITESAAAVLGDTPVTQALRESYRPGETFGSAFARLFARLFADWGVILLDASDPELHLIAGPIYRAALERAPELDEALLARGKELETAGYHQQVKVTPSSTLLFTRRDGARVPVHRRGNGSSGQFVIEKEVVAQPEMLDRIASSPRSFSPNVLLRPVVQDYLLPTLAYTGGSAEVAYFAQAAVVYEKLLGRVTPIVPRFSATIVDSKARSLLDRYHLNLPNLFHGPEQLRERLAVHSLPNELQSNFDQANSFLQGSMTAIRNSLSQLDKTLVDAAENAESKIRHQLESLRARAARAELRQSEVLGRHAALLSNSLYPNKVLQEREIAGVYLLSRQGTELLRKLYDSIHTDCLDHQVISL
jgi:bacillithiol synthase